MKAVSRKYYYMDANGSDVTVIVPVSAETLAEEYVLYYKAGRDGDSPPQCLWTEGWQILEMKKAYWAGRESRG